MPKVPAGTSARDLTSLAARLSGAWSVLRGRSFGPGEPMAAQGTPEEQHDGPRQYQYPFAVNRSITPRRDYGLNPFEQLRSLAAGYDVAALCIAARIEQMCGFPLTFVAKDKRQQRDLQERCDEAEAWWSSPDKQTDWAAWLSMLLYETFSIDATTIYRRPDQAGRLYGLDLVDGATIKPLVDDRGRTLAYQQVLYGLPMSNYGRAGADAPDEELPSWSREQLIYKPRWTRTFTPYGFPPTEWIILRVNTALRKQTYDLSYFTDGNIPGGLASPPEGTKLDPNQVQKFEEAFNAALEGDAGRLNRIKFTPWPMDYKEFRQFSYETTLDRWMLGVTCAAYGISPQELGFVEDVNRSSGEIQENINQRRGLGPIKRWLKSIVDPITNNDLRLPGIEAQFGGGEENEDKAAQATVDKTYWDMGVVSADEVRALRYGDVLDGEAPGGKTPAALAAPAPGGQPATQEALFRERLALPAPPIVTTVGKLAKADGTADGDPWQWTERDGREQQAADIIRRAYADQQKRITAQLRETGVEGLDGAFWETTAQQFEQRVLPVFDDTMLDGAAAGIDRIGIGVDWGSVNVAVLAQARAQAAQFAADETAATQRAVDQLVADWLASGAGDMAQLIERVAKVWPDKRPDAAAITAVTNTFSEGQWAAWVASGVVSGYSVNTANDARVCPKCNKKAYVDPERRTVRIVYTLDDKTGLPSFHWCCRCDIDPVVKGPDEL